jgi:transposase-like protein
LYARGLSVREIQRHLKEIYGAKVSLSLISSVTDAVSEDVKLRQARPLNALYPILYLDCIHVKVRDSGAVRNKTVYLAICVNMEGHKEVLGLWIAQTEGAKFWLQVITELKKPERARYLHRLRRRAKRLPRYCVNLPVGRRSLSLSFSRQYALSKKPQWARVTR